MASSRCAHPLLSTPGVDAVAIADVDADGCNDVVAAGVYGTGMVHLGDGTGGFDGGQDLPQIGYQNPATATRVTMAVDDLTGDGKPEIVISDQGNCDRDGLPQQLHTIRVRVLRAAAASAAASASAAAASAAASASASAAAAAAWYLLRPGQRANARRDTGRRRARGHRRQGCAQWAWRGRLPVRTLGRRSPLWRDRSRHPEGRQRQ